MNGDKKKPDGSKTAAWAVGETDKQNRGRGRAVYNHQKGRQQGEKTRDEPWETDLQQNQDEAGRTRPPTPKNHYE